MKLDNWQIVDAMEGGDYLAAARLIADHYGLPHGILQDPAINKFPSVSISEIVVEVESGRYSWRHNSGRSGFSSATWARPNGFGKCCISVWVPDSHRK